MTTIMTMFASFVAFVGATILITETINKIFKIEKTQPTKLIISWVMSIGLAALGFGFQLGFFVDCGTPDQWQGLGKTAPHRSRLRFICANKMYDREEIWRLLK